MTTKDLAKAGIMAALIYLGTYIFKIPSPNGYTHLGDCMIFIAVLILGKRNAAFSAGIGAALADAMGGYMQWVIPTFFIKAIMALIMGLVVEKLLPNARFGWAVGAVLGGIFQIVMYTVVKFFMYDVAYALTRLPGLIVQTTCGVVIAGVIIAVLNESGLIRRLKEV